MLTRDALIFYLPLIDTTDFFLHVLLSLRYDADSHVSG